jgi:hypothetical protein
LTGFGATPLSIAMIAAFILFAGGIKLLLGQSDRKRGILMIVAALVLIGNVLVWTL